MKIIANIYYFRRISRIGGTEQFLYEIAKKYHGTGLAILYDEADTDQLLRLRALVRCIRRQPGQTYKAKRAFYNFNLEALPQIEADEHIFVCHAIYQHISQIPPLNHPKLTRWIGVSEYACRELKRYGEALGVNIKPELCYNPLELEPMTRVLRIISACRLDDKVKGGDRTLRLIEALDRYSERSGRNYIWTIYTNSTNMLIRSPNVALMKPRVDIRPYIADSDWLVQLSNDMESYCYSINEALGYGVRIVRTPLSVAKELNIPKQAELVCDWEMANADEVAKQMFEMDHLPFHYEPPRDGWNKLLAKGKSTYKPDKTNVEVVPIARYYDLELHQDVSQYTRPFEVSLERAKHLSDLGLVRIL